MNDNNLKPILQVAIDGPAASGKSTVSRLTAERINAFYVNSGDIYRALTWLALKESIDPENDQKGMVKLITKHDIRFCHDQRKYGNELHLFVDNNPIDRKKMRSPEVTEKVSFTAKIPRLRERIIDLQRNVKSMGSIVMEGRDIGTVIFPEARYKFFITANPEERARRRLKQVGEVYSQATLQSLTKEIQQRDRIDSTRLIAPLKPASDAFVIDTTGLTIDEVVNRMLAIIENGNP